MARATIKNQITTAETINQILQENKNLINDFLIYLKSIDRSPNTIKQYKNDLEIFFVYNLQNNNNKPFVDITKREFVRFQSYAIEEWKWSPNRLRRVKSVLSSLSNYIENILDDEYPNFRNLIAKIESPAKQNVRENTVFTDEELQKLLDHLVSTNQIKQAAMLALAMYSGRRKTELTLFKVSYFKDENIIFNTFWRTDEKIRTKGKGVQGKMINLYILRDKFQPYLNLWLKYREDNHIESEWLFPSIKDPSQPINIETLNYWADVFTAFLKKDFYWHSMRHYFTTMLARQNVPNNIIQEIVNWESADMVDLYTDISKEEKIGKYFLENKLE